MSELTAHAMMVLKNATGANGELGRQTAVNILASALARIAELEAALDELRQSLIGGIEGVRAGRPMDKWADANERLLKAIRARGSK